MVTLSRKENKKILEKEESKPDWEEDMDAATEQAIIKITRTKEARSVLRDLIASITVQESAVAKSIPAATQKTPTKSSAITTRVSSKLKGAQASEGVTAPEEPEHKRTRPMQPKAIEPAGTQPISPTPS